MENPSNNKILIYNIILGSIIVIFVFAIMYFLFAKNEPLPSVGNLPKNKSNNGGSQAIDAYNKNDFASANKIIDAQLSQNQNDVQSLLLKAFTLAQQGSLEFREKELGDQAMQYVLKAIQIEPDSANAYVIMGYIYEIEQQYSDAYEAYDKAISLDPNSDEAYAHKGHAKQLEGISEEALSNYNKALEINKDNVLANFGLAKNLSQNGKQAEALEIFQKIPSLDSNNRQKAEAYYSSGVINDALNPKDLSNTKRMIDMSIQVDPSYAQAYVKLADILFKMGIEAGNSQTQYIKDSFSNLDKALSMNKGLSIANLQLATEYAAIGKVKNAKIILSGLQQIIKNDITLDKNEKEDLLNVAKKFQSKLK